MRCRKPEATVERRTSTRRPLHPKCRDQLHVSVGISSWPVDILDLSPTGIGLLIGQRHETGTLLPLQIVHPALNITLPMQIQVVRTVRRHDGYWVTGCTFQRRLDAGEVELLIKS